MRDNVRESVKMIETINVAKIGSINCHPPTRPIISKTNFWCQMFVLKWCEVALLVLSATRHQPPFLYSRHFALYATFAAIDVVTRIGTQMPSS